MTLFVVCEVGEEGRSESLQLLAGVSKKIVSECCRKAVQQEEVSESSPPHRYPSCNNSGGISH